MGGCYSSESHKALSLPKHKWNRHSGRKMDQHAAVSNGTASHPPEIRLVKHADGGAFDGNVEGGEASPLLEEQKGVAPSDSGIESIGPAPEDTAVFQPVKQQPFTLCQTCQQKLKRLSVSSCRRCGQLQVNGAELSALVYGETYCTCGSREAGKQFHCSTHGVRGSSVPDSQRHSDIPAALLKPSLKRVGLDKGDKSGKHVRMSWKSANSLDGLAAAFITNTCMDRAKSEQSEVFSDDVSFRAPLAEFDSVDRHLDSDAVQCDGAFLASQMSIYSELLDVADSLCKCDFSAALTAHSGLGKTPDAPTPDIGSVSNYLTGGRVYLDAIEDDEDSGHGISKSNDRPHPSSDSERGVIEEVDSMGMKSPPSLSSSPCRLGSMPEQLELDELQDLELLGPVSIVLKGRQIVVINADTYLQLMTDLAMLRQQLGHLTQVIQEEDLQALELQPDDTDF